MLRMVLTAVQVFISLGIIGLVLLQRGKGADAGAGFGAGASGTVFGARGAKTALSRATAIFAAVFMLNSLALAYMGSQQAVTQPKTILDEAATPAAPAIPNAPGTGATPAAGSAPVASGAPATPAPAASAPAAAPAPAPSGTPGVPAPAPEK